MFTLPILLYALFTFKQVRHTCCLSLHVHVHCIACNCMFLYVPRWLSSKAWASNPLVDGHKFTYLVLTCRKTPINQLYFTVAVKAIDVLALMLLHWELNHRPILFTIFCCDQILSIECGIWRVKRERNWHANYTLVDSEVATFMPAACVSNPPLTRLNQAISDTQWLASCDSTRDSDLVVILFALFIGPRDI